MNPFSKEEKLRMMKALMWDYNIPPEDCLEVLEGKRKNAGHYTEETLFRKALESFPWFTILNLLGVKRIKELLTEQVIRSLRTKSLRTAYEFVRSRLHQSVQTAG